VWECRCYKRQLNYIRLKYIFEKKTLSKEKLNFNGTVGTLETKIMLYRSKEIKKYFNRKISTSLNQ